MNSKISHDLQAEYEAAFVFPFASYAWRSKRARQCWLDLEIWMDALAGPVFSIVQTGSCAYVYARDDEYFSGICTPDGLLGRLHKWSQRITDGLNQFTAADQNEQSDLEAMDRFATQMWAVAEKAILIERQRFGV